MAANAPAPKQMSGLQWLGLFGVFSFLMVMAAESDQYGDIAVALTWLAAAGATVYWWNDFDQNFASLLGLPAQTPVKSSSIAGPVT